MIKWNISLWLCIYWFVTWYKSPHTFLPRSRERWLGNIFAWHDEWNYSVDLFDRCV